jgi:hypothetical protein
MGPSSICGKTEHRDGRAVLDEHRAHRAADAARPSGYDPDSSFER